MSVTDLLIILYLLAILAGMAVFAAKGLRWWRPLLILLVLSLAGLSLVWPGVYGPGQRLKPGLDLAGGTTLVYDVDIPDNANANEVINDTIDILKERVDPTGTKNLVWRQVAGNRIEIQMPLATATTKERRAEYRQAREALLQQNLTQRTVNNVLRMEPEQRRQRIDELAGENEQLQQQLEKLVQLNDELTEATGPYRQAQQDYQQAQREYEQAQQELEQLGDDAPEQQREELKQHHERLQQQLNQAKQRMAEATSHYVEAREAFRQQREAVLQRNIDAAELDRMLEMSDQPQDGGASARQQAIQQLKQEHPGRADQIEEVVSKYEAYEQVRGPFDDPEDLIALLEGSGVVEFRIAATTRGAASLDVEQYRQRLAEKGPRAGRDQPWRWFQIDDPASFAPDDESLERLKEDPVGYFEARDMVAAEYGGDHYLLLGNQAGRTAITRQQAGWELASASSARDQKGFRAVSFRLNEVGAQLMGTLTGQHEQEPMAILLDDQIISAPTIQQRLTKQIMVSGGQGGFSEQEQNYLLRTLKAGSLEGQLQGPISVQTTGPRLGQDNLAAGFKASVWALILVAAVAAGYYFFAGAVADFALLANMLIILGVMAMINATFTLPGIAGLVLTIGMAIDANVLIFERIREELERGSMVYHAIRNGYQKALSTVLDANLTTLITCVVLYYTATAEVKGFALVLGIGIVATLFTALFCTRELLDLWVTYGRSHRLTMLPTVVPAVRRALSPNADWTGRRYIGFALSGLVLVGAVFLVQGRGVNMLDIEFRSGTEVTFELREGERLPVQEVRQRLHAYGEVASQMQQGASAADLPEARREIYRDLEPIFQQLNRNGGEGAQAGAMSAGAGPQASQQVDLSLFRQASVVTLGQTENGEANSFSVSTLITNNQAVSSVVKAAFEPYLDEGKARPISFAQMDVENVASLANDALYPISRTNEAGEAILGLNIERPEVQNEVSEFLGGAAFVLRDLQPAASPEDIENRIDRMLMRPDYADLSYRRFDVLGLDAAEGEVDGEPAYESVVVLVRGDDVDYQANPEQLTVSEGLAATTWPLIKDAMERDTTLGSVSNFSSQISATMQQQAIVAMVLALLAVVVYIWFRFGSLRYGLAAIAALVHDVTITLGMVALAGWAYDTAIGSALLFDPFKIDLAMVAALLTIVGYSLNDTIVVFDRIRENRGRLAHATPGIINDSINQTISRTALTSGTTLIAVLVLYIFGGAGVHGFAFAMIVGVIVGTYSSIAVSSPLLLVGTGGGSAAGAESGKASGALSGKGSSREQAAAISGQ